MTRKTDYEIGYGKPPKHAQWKKGQSGNPKGRRRKTADPTALLAQLLSKRVVVRNGRTTKRVTQLEQILLRLIEDARKGDPRLMKLALDEMRKAEARAAEEAPEELGPADHEVIRGIYARIEQNVRNRMKEAGD